MVGSPALAGQNSASPNCLELVGLSPLMARTSGTPEIPIGLIDGPVRLDHPDLVTEKYPRSTGQAHWGRSPAADHDRAASAERMGGLRGDVHGSKLSQML